MATINDNPEHEARSWEDILKKYPFLAETKSRQQLEELIDRYPDIPKEAIELYDEAFPEKAEEAEDKEKEKGKEGHKKDEKHAGHGEAHFDDDLHMIKQDGTQANYLDEDARYQKLLHEKTENWKKAHYGAPEEERNAYLSTTPEAPKDQVDKLFPLEKAYSQLEIDAIDEMKHHSPKTMEKYAEHQQKRIYANFTEDPAYRAALLAAREKTRATYQKALKDKLPLTDEQLTTLFITDQLKGLNSFMKKYPEKTKAYIKQGNVILLKTVSLQHEPNAGDAADVIRLQKLKDKIAKKNPGDKSATEQKREAALTIIGAKLASLQEQINANPTPEVLKEYQLLIMAQSAITTSSAESLDKEIQRARLAMSALRSQQSPEAESTPVDKQKEAATKTPPAPKAPPSGTAAKAAGKAAVITTLVTTVEEDLGELIDDDDEEDLNNQIAMEQYDQEGGEGEDEDNEAIGGEDGGDYGDEDGYGGGGGGGDDDEQRGGGNAFDQARDMYDRFGGEGAGEAAGEMAGEAAAGEAGAAAAGETAATAGAAEAGAAAAGEAGAAAAAGAAAGEAGAAAAAGGAASAAGAAAAGAGAAAAGAGAAGAGAAAGGAAATGAAAGAAAGAPVLLIVAIVVLVLLLIFLLGYGIYLLFTSGSDQLAQKPPDLAQVTINKSGPATATNGTDIIYTLNVSYPGIADDILVKEPIPDNADFVSASGNYQQNGNLITWSFKDNQTTSSSTTPSKTVNTETYTKPPYNLPIPQKDTTDTTYSPTELANLNTLGSNVASFQSYLTGVMGDAKFVDPFVSVIWSGAIEGTRGNNYSWNCFDKRDPALITINQGCKGHFASGQWQVSYGIQPSQAISHIIRDFKEVYGDEEAATVQQVGQAVITDSAQSSAGQITNPATFPTIKLSDLVGKASGGDVASQQAIAVLLMDPKLGAVSIAQEVGRDIARNNDWRGTMEGWGSYYRTNMQNFSNRMQEIAKGYTGGSSFAPQTFTITLRPKTNDTYIINQASAQVFSSQSSQTGTPNVPSVNDDNLAPTDDNCASAYFFSSPLNKNFGDPACALITAGGVVDQQKIEAFITQLDPTGASTWISIIIPCNGGFDPNAYFPDNGGEWGMFGMGASVNGAGTSGNGPNGTYDRGDVNWTKQIKNAIAYNADLAARGQKWQYWSRCNLPPNLP